MIGEATALSRLDLLRNGKVWLSDATAKHDKVVISNGSEGHSVAVIGNGKDNLRIEKPWHSFERKIKAKARP